MDLMSHFIRHPQAKPSIFFRASGMTLAEVVVSTAIAGIVLLICGQAFVFLARGQAALSTTQTRDELVELIRSHGARIKTINLSATIAGNEKLKKCLTGIDGSDCKSHEFYPLKLHTGPSAADAISGPVTAPVRYSLGGRPCEAAEPNSSCPFQVATTFRVQCKPVASLVPNMTCPGVKPELIEILFGVILAKDVSLPASAAEPNLKETWGSIMVEL
jgi:hypothetical protein